jgi:hypothetical protein
MTATAKRKLLIAKNADTVKRFRVTDRDGVARVWSVSETALCQFRREKSDASAIIDLSNASHGSIELLTDGVIKITVKKTHADDLALGDGWFDVVISNSSPALLTRLIEGRFEIVEGVTR